MTFQQVTLVVPLGPNVPGMSVGEYDINLLRLERSLCSQFGGWTAVDGRGAGLSEDGDTLHEQVRVYTLAAYIGLTSDDLAELRQLVKVLLDQRAVYLAAYDLAEKPIQ